MAERELKKLAARVESLFEGIYELTNKVDKQIYIDFQRLPPRTGSDYYKYILKPISLHTIGRQIKRLAYKDPQAFVDDLAQISWNARHYNEPGSEIYENALVLDVYIKETVIPKLSGPDEPLLQYPDLGPLDDYSGVRYDDDNASASPYTKQEDEDYDDLVHGYGGINSKAVLTPPKVVEGGVRRGRPPIIDKPYESRIKLILKLFKRIRHPDNENHILTLHFERLPDKNISEYYEMVQNPVSLHEIRTKVRLRKYNDVQQFLDDLSLMITNNKLFYASNPSMMHEISLFESQAEQIVEKEMQRPDSDFIIATALGTEGLKVPLDSVTVNDRLYKVGDWVLIRNPNDAKKPICGQIFRLWLTDGVQYTNVCWYIRPEQTCHRVDRLFYMNEVCKTGEYRDHLAEDIVAPCFVIFLTHYQKGDIPPGLLPPGSEWFICEFRYNANTYVFNRIRTWKACLPDEIRHIDQPIVPIYEPRKLVKYDSPIKQLLPPDAQNDVVMSGPTPGPNTNGPPVVGAVYKKPPYVTDELGQCSTSPNVVRAPEYDDAVSGRLAYIFTPVSQMKLVSGSGIYSSSGTRSVAVSYNPSKQEMASNTASPSLDSQGFNPLIQHQQQHAFPPTTAYKPYVTLKPDSTPLAAGTPAYGGYGLPMGTGLLVTPSTYSHVLPNGAVSYLEKYGEEDQEEKEQRAAVLSLSELLVTLADSVVWFRAPPTKINSRTLTPVAHLAKYLAWKIKRGKA